MRVPGGARQRGSALSRIRSLELLWRMGQACWPGPRAWRAMRTRFLRDGLAARRRLRGRRTSGSDRAAGASGPARGAACRAETRPCFAATAELAAGRPRPATAWVRSRQLGGRSGLACDRRGPAVGVVRSMAESAGGVERRRALFRLRSTRRSSGAAWPASARPRPLAGRPPERRLRTAPDCISSGAGRSITSRRRR